MFCSVIPAFPAPQSRYSIPSSFTSTNKAGAGGTFQHTQQQQQRNVGPSKKMPRRPQQVRINPLVMVRPSLHVCDYTPEEVQQTWYTRKEIKDLKIEGKRLAGIDGHDEVDAQLGMSCASPSRWNSPTSTKMGRAGSKTPPPPTTPVPEGVSNNCLRGLEGKTTFGLYRKRQVKSNAKDAVLREQQRQWHRGVYDAEAIAEAYFEVAEEAQVTAYMLGLRDEKEVRSMAEPTTTKSKSRGGGGFGNPLLKVTLQRWQSFEKHTQLL